MKLEDALRLVNVPPWWQHTRGRGVKVAVLGTPAGKEYAIPVNYTDELDWHEQASAYLIKQMAPEATVYGLAFFGDRYKGNWKLQDCLRWCLENQIDILSMSFSTTKTSEKEELLRQLVEQGCIPFASAGNSGDKGVKWPGRSPHTICVGAYSDIRDAISPGSSIGPEVTLLAPTGIFVPTPSGNWITYPDTSGATPVAAGMTVLWKSLTGGNLEEFLEFVKANSRDMYEPGHDEISGYGLFVLPDPATLLVPKPEPREEEKPMPKKPKVYLSPSTQGANMYAGGLSTEKQHMQDVGALVERHLARCGFEVRRNRPEMTLAQAVSDSNAWGPDAHVAIHSNAGGGQGTECWCYTGSTKGQALARAVYAEVASLTPTPDRGTKSTTSLYELRETNAPACILEVEFHDSATGATWIVAHKAELAEAIAKGVCMYFGVAWAPASQPELPKPDPAPAKITLKLTVGGRQITRSDGKVFPLDVPARVENGRTLVPLRAICEALGAFVHFENGEIIITL